MLGVFSERRDALVRRRPPPGSPTWRTVRPKKHIEAPLSFVFKLDAGAERTIWTLLRGGRLDEVSRQMARFVHAGGVRRKGLVNRRAAEIQLWRQGQRNHTCRWRSRIYGLH